MTNALMPCKLETMIYAAGNGTYSVFTLNPNLQKQLADLSEQHPEVCCCKAKGEASSATYQVRNAAVLIEPQKPY